MQKLNESFISDDDVEEPDSDFGKPLEHFKSTVKDIILAHKKAK